MFINVGIYDEVRKGTDKVMGSALFEIGDVLGSRGSVKAKKLRKGGSVYARVVKAPDTPSSTLTLGMRGVKLTNVDGFFGQSDPFFELSRMNQGPAGESWQVVYRSSHIPNQLSPTWEPAEVDLNRLCDGDLDRSIKVTIFDYEKSGKHQYMGMFETDTSSLIRAKVDGGTRDVKSLDKTKAFHVTGKKKKKDYGKIVVVEATLSQSRSAAPTSTEQYPQAYVPSVAPIPIPFNPQISVAPPQQSNNGPSFVDYILGSCQLSMCVAIDFTGSNGDPRKPGTLHYLNPHTTERVRNDYERAIMGVGSIVAKYDSDQKFPVWGFGAKYGGQIQHCFQVGPTSEVHGVPSILDSYRGVFQTKLTMSGPTVFTEVISLAAATAQSEQDLAQTRGEQAYTILLILTDGAVTDVRATAAAIQRASSAPLSIVIVGIGNADFSAMQHLDDFDANNGAKRRDIVQFVEFSKHRDNKNALTQATLEEIPDQLVEYFSSRGIKPTLARNESQFNIVPDEFNEEMDVDLSIDFNDEGEITLNDDDEQGTHGLYLDDSYNGTNYAGVAIMPPPATAPTYAPPAAYVPPPY
eukprot:scaffold118712_cov51-Attheya_sp.AAC.3